MTPTTEEIRAARQAASHTLAQAAATIYSDRGQTWQDYEAGRRAMPLVAWEMYLLRTGQHPRWVLTDRC